MTQPQVKPRSQWNLLQLIRAQSGTINWHPIVTFFPKGTIVEDRDADGMVILERFIAEGYVEETKPAVGFPTYSITPLGVDRLGRIEADNAAGGCGRLPTTAEGGEEDGSK